MPIINRKQNSGDMGWKQYKNLQTILYPLLRRITNQFRFFKFPFKKIIIENIFYERCVSESVDDRWCIVAVKLLKIILGSTKFFN